MTQLLSDGDVIERIFHHIDHKTTDIGETIWREPTENYHSTERFEAEIELLRRLPVPFCPSAALPENGSYVARTAAGTPLLVVRGDHGVVRAFRNACRHRGMAVAKDSGCARAFVCPYHSWTYGLDGRLKHVPGADGFPGLETEQHGLIPVTAEERGGLVLVTQDAPYPTARWTNFLIYSTPNNRSLTPPLSMMRRIGSCSAKLRWKATISRGCTIVPSFPTVMTI